MCLDVTAPRGSKRRKVYKVLELRGGKYYTPYQNIRVENYKKGCVLAAAESTVDRNYQNGDKISKGAIHVFTSLKDALIDSYRWGQEGFAQHVFVCSVNPSDWVADGITQAGIRLRKRLYFSSATYTKIKFTGEIIKPTPELVEKFKLDHYVS